MRDARVPAIDLRVDRVLVRARHLRADAARELGSAVAQALPAALTGVVERAHRAANGGPANIAALAVHVKNTPRAADIAASAGSAAAAALASRLVQPKGGAR